jgi:glycerol-3-phosphate cytidylyltransferase
MNKSKNKNKVIITFGTFDLMHNGHINILNRAANLGDTLIVGISSDKFNYNKKNKYPIFSQSDRQSLISSIKCVDETFLEESMAQKREYILKYNADILVMGDDWEGKFDEFKDICEVVYFPRTKDISTTEILGDVVQRNLIKYISLTQSEADILYSLMEKTIKILYEYNIEYFAIGGTLLGAVRNKSLIPWLYDLDIAILQKYVKIFEYGEFIQNLESNNIYLKKTDMGYCFLYKGFKLNIYIMDIHNDKIIFNNDISKTIWADRHINISDIYPLKDYEFGKLKIKGLKTPHNFFISCNYGKNYMTHGKITNKYYSTKHTTMVTFLTEKKLNIVTSPELLYHKY